MQLLVLVAQHHSTSELEPTKLEALLQNLLWKRNKRRRNEEIHIYKRNVRFERVKNLHTHALSLFCSLSGFCNTLVSTNDSINTHIHLHLQMCAYNIYHMHLVYLCYVHIMSND